jgi:serine protease AprX
MPTPIGNGPSSPQSFDFQRLQKIVNLVEGSPFMTVDSARIGAPAEAAGGPQDVIIMKPSGELFKSTPEDSAQVAKELGEKGVQVGENLDLLGGVTAQIDPSQAKQLESQGYKVFDNSRRSLVPGIPHSRRSFAADGDDVSMPKVDPVALTHADAVQQKGFTGKGQVIAVIDSGFDHPGTGLVAWKDFVDGSEQPMDPVGHGTHVGGDILQIAPDAQLVGVRVMNADGQGRPSDIIRGIQWAVQNKEKYHISVINMSLGGEPMGVPSSENPLDRAVEAAIKKGITVVSAAGNSGPQEHTIGSPADDPLGIAVGSGLDAKHLSDFSSRGPTDDGQDKPDVVAPGEFIVSWAVPGSQMDQMGTVIEKLRHMPDDQLVKLLHAKPQLIEGLGLPKNILQMPSDERLRTLHKALPPIYKPDEQHIAAPGTSFASPITAGVIADLKSADPTLTPSKVKDTLTSTADPMGSQFGADDQGAGFVNADKALASVQSGRA